MRWVLVLAVLFGSGCPIPVSLRGHGNDPPGSNDVPGVDWVRLFRDRCTGGVRSPRCESYTVTIRADGRTLWDGHHLVDVEGERPLEIPAARAVRIIERSAARIETLRAFGCNIDHTHYVTLEVGRAGEAQTLRARGCGERFYRAARAIDQAARTRRVR